MASPSRSMITKQLDTGRSQSTRSGKSVADLAQQKLRLEQETICCSICLDLLKGPVTIPCGHSYCMSCIKTQWDREHGKGVYSCPQCRRTFLKRPVLKKNIMLADLLEVLNDPRFHAAVPPAEPCDAGPEDVACDICTRRKSRALKSCLACLASYCEKHLQPHFHAAPLQKHKLVEPCKNLQQNICSHHDEAMKMFCRTDQQCICYLCSVDGHKGHDTVLAAAERTERQVQLERTHRDVQQKLLDTEKDMVLLQQEVDALTRSADKAVEDSERIFTQLICLLKTRSLDVRERIRTQQETEVGQVKAVRERLEQEVTELRTRVAELKQLLESEDNNWFLHNYSSVATLGESTLASGIRVRPLRYFDHVKTAVSEVGVRLQDVLSEAWTNVSWTVTQVDALLTQPEPKSRSDFLEFYREITMDPNTAYAYLSLSEDYRRVTCMAEKQSYPHHPDRFNGWHQVLSREHLTGRCYWEVQWVGGPISLAVAYGDMSRAGWLDECEFGANSKSWALYNNRKRHYFYHNKVQSPVSGPQSSRMGVYLDHSAGTLSFYSVCDTMVLLHRVHTKFIQPLHAGLCLYNFRSIAEFCHLK